MVLKDYREFQVDELPIKPNLKVGDRVIIQDAMLYTDRVGILEVAGSGSIWDFHVRLEPVDNDRIKDRVIGIHDFQARLIKESS